MSPSGRIIVLKGDPIVKEAKAAAALSPGHRLDLSLSGGNLEVTAGGAGTEADPKRKAFAVEADVVGNTAADAYALGDQVKYVVAKSGDEIMVRAATGLTWVTGAPLYAVAGGQVSDVSPGAVGAEVSPIGYALSDETATTADQLVPMEVA